MSKLRKDSSRLEEKIEVDCKHSKLELARTVKNFLSLLRNKTSLPIMNYLCSEVLNCKSCEIEPRTERLRLNARTKAYVCQENSYENFPGCWEYHFLNHNSQFPSQLLVFLFTQQLSNQGPQPANDKHMLCTWPDC